MTGWQAPAAAERPAVRHHGGPRFRQLRGFSHGFDLVLAALFVAAFRLTPASGTWSPTPNAVGDRTTAR